MRPTPTSLTAAAAAAVLVLSACGGSGDDVRFPSLGVIPNKPVPLPAAPTFSRPMGETNIEYGTVVMDGVCAGVISLINTSDRPAGIEAEVEFFAGEETIAVRRYAWWPATKPKGPFLPTEAALAPGEKGIMELTNDAIDGINGPFTKDPTGCRVTAAHIEVDPKPRPCEEKHGPGCGLGGKAYVAGRDVKQGNSVTGLSGAPATTAPASASAPAGGAAAPAPAPTELPGEAPAPKDTVIGTGTIKVPTTSR